MPHAALCATLFPDVAAQAIALGDDRGDAALGGANGGNDYDATGGDGGGGGGGEQGTLAEGATKAILGSDGSKIGEDYRRHKEALVAVIGDLARDGGDRKAVLSIDAVGGVQELVRRVDKAAVETVVAGEEGRARTSSERFAGYGNGKAARMRTSDAEAVFNGF